MIGTFGTSGVRCRIKAGWAEAGKEGEIIAYFTQCCNQMWALVKWDDEEDPDCHKAAGIEIKQLGERYWHKI